MNAYEYVRRNNAGLHYNNHVLPRKLLAPLTGKYAKLRDDLKKALTVGCAAKDANSEESGTCNLETLSLRSPADTPARWNRLQKRLCQLQRMSYYPRLAFDLREKKEEDGGSCSGKRQHQPKPCPHVFKKIRTGPLNTRAASVSSVLRQPVQAGVLQQSKDQPNQFSGS